MSIEIRVLQGDGKRLSRKGDERHEAFDGLIVQHFPSELRGDLKQVSAVKRTSNGKISLIVSHITSSRLNND